MNLLSRLLPFVLNHDNDKFVSTLFFENALLPELVVPKQPKPQTPQDAATNGATPAADAQQQQQQQQQQQPAAAAAAVAAAPATPEKKMKTVRFATIGDHPLQVTLAEALVTTLCNGKYFAF